MNKQTEDFSRYLQPTVFIDSDAQRVIEFARAAARGRLDPVEKAVSLYYAVRDQVRYDPYRVDLDRSALRASTILEKGYGYCVAKAIVLAAVARAEGIPSRLGFADVRNHLTTERLRQMMGTDVFVFHGYAELFPDDHWVKVTPTFNLSLCEKFGVKPLDFDGRHDALFHPYDRQGRRHMEYIHEHGHFTDLPYEQLVARFRESYPIYSERPEEAAKGNFEKEAQDERDGH